MDDPPSMVALARAAFRGRRPLLWAGALVAAGCHSTAAPSTVTPVRSASVPSPCRIEPDSTVPPADTAIMVGTEPQGRSPDYLEPRTATERLVARQLYQPLIRIDCQGRIAPGLARRWEPDQSGTWWTFELIEGLQFADGTPIDAAAVRSGWDRRAGGSWPWRGLAEVVIRGPAMIAIRMVEPSPEPPVVLAEHPFAVGGPVGTNGTAAESGPFRVASNSVPGRVILEAVGAGRPRFLVIEPSNDRDPRDALDRARPPELLLTRDPATPAYARSRPGFTARSLDWDRTYFLVTTPSASPALVPPVEDRRSLAALAVRGDVRGAEPPFSIRSDSSCGQPPGGSTPRPVVGYLAGDPVARDLGERIVALSGAPSPPAWLGRGPGAPRLTALPLDGQALDVAVAGGSVMVAVVGSPRYPPAGCGGALRIPRGAGRIPLVDSRATVIIKAGAPAIETDGDGTVRVIPVPR